MPESRFRGCVLLELKGRTRILSVMLGATVYTFAIILAVYLVGLGLGSGIGSVLASRVARVRVAFGVCQLLLAAFDCVDGMDAVEVTAILADRPIARGKSVV